MLSAVIGPDPAIVCTSSAAASVRSAIASDPMIRPQAHT